MPSPRTPPHSLQPWQDTVGQGVLPLPSRERATRWGLHLLLAHPSPTLREPSAGPRHGRCRPGPRGSGQGWAEPGTDVGKPLPCVLALSLEWAPQAAWPQCSPSGRPHTRGCACGRAIPAALSGSASREPRARHGRGWALAARAAALPSLGRSHTGPSSSATGPLSVLSLRLLAGFAEGTPATGELPCSDPDTSR